MKNNKNQISQEKAKKLCDLYHWLNLFVELVGKERLDDLQKLEDECFKKRNNTLGRCNAEMDLYRSFASSWQKFLNEDEIKLYTKIEKELSPKNRKCLNEEKVKADVCEFRLKLDDLSVRRTVVSRLYTAYPKVRDRLYKQLYTIFKKTEDMEIQDMIAQTIFGDQAEFQKRIIKISNAIEKANNNPKLRKERYKQKCKSMEELRKADYECYSKLHK